jgi:hypothetical protein
MLKPELLCSVQDFCNGSSPGWSRGNSPLVRKGDRVFCTDSQVTPGREPFNHTVMRLFEKAGDGPWRVVYEDTGVFQREPCPVVLAGDRLLVTVNPTSRTYAPEEPSRVVPCIPKLYVFDVSSEVRLEKILPMPWSTETCTFLDHSYRGGAVDALTGDLFFDNLHYPPGSEGEHLYALLDQALNPVRTEDLSFPERSCYHNIALRGGEAYVFAVQDIVEPNSEWLAYKRQVTGQEWDFDFRTVWLNYTPDIGTQPFAPSVHVCDREATCGWTDNLDCCYAADGSMLLAVREENVRQRFMRDRFFPQEELYSVLNVYRFRHGKLQEVFCVDRSGEETGGAVSYCGFFHTAADGSVYLLWNKTDNGEAGDRRPGTYLMPLADRKSRFLTPQTGVLFGSKTRLGAAPDDRADLLWCAETGIYYACADLSKEL